MLQYNDSMGPIIKILIKMLQDFFNYSVIFLISTVMFALVGNINFLYDIDGYESFFISCLTVIDDSLGNFDFNIFKVLNDPGLEFFG